MGRKTEAQGNSSGNQAIESVEIVSKDQSSLSCCFKMTF